MPAPRGLDWRRGLLAQSPRETAHDRRLRRTARASARACATTADLRRGTGRRCHETANGCENTHAHLQLEGTSEQRVVGTLCSASGRHALDYWGRGRQSPKVCRAHSRPRDGRGCRAFPLPGSSPFWVCRSGSGGCGRDLRRHIARPSQGLTAQRAPNRLCSMPRDRLPPITWHRDVAGECGLTARQRRWRVPPA